MGYFQRHVGTPGVVRGHIRFTCVDDVVSLDGPRLEGRGEELVLGHRGAAVVVAPGEGAMSPVVDVGALGTDRSEVADQLFPFLLRDCQPLRAPLAIGVALQEVAILLCLDPRAELVSVDPLRQVVGRTGHISEDRLIVDGRNREVLAAGEGAGRREHCDSGNQD